MQNIIYKTVRTNLILVTVVILEKQKKAKSLQAKKVRYFVFIIYCFFFLHYRLVDIASTTQWSCPLWKLVCSMI